MWKLVIEDDEGNRTVVPLARDQYSIGRRDGNTIRLTERNVSRDHARLVRKGSAKGANGAASGNGAAAQGATTARQSKPDLSKPSEEGAATNGPASGAAANGDLYVLEDLTSYNGVFVNGLRIHHSQDLTQGDLVQIGDYRIILQDESQAAAGATTTESDPAKVTLPGAPFARAAGLLDRPNRFVMLVGPAPGSEYPLDRDLMTVGRAEDASISVNHNSVSRTHCEIHALGQGRYEIVDKGSSNGVRVNGSDLRRGIVEPGDLIELGDVRFKFIGAGQVFRPTDSQQFTILSESDSTDVHVRRPKRNAGLVPAGVFVGIVALGALAVFLRARSHGEAASDPTAAAAAPSHEQAAVDEAKKTCASGGDCDTARMKLESLVPDTSPLRGSPDFRDVETRAADQVLARADAETDATRKRSLYQRVAQNVAVDSSRRKIAADKLQQLDSPPAAAEANQLPVAVQAEVPSLPGSAPTPAPHGRRAAAAAAAEPDQGMVAAASPSPGPAAAAAPKANVDDHERQLALQGTQDSKVLLKQQLEPRVFGGRASDTEIRLLISTCKDLGDRLCVQQARAVQAQRSQ